MAGLEPAPVEQPPTPLLDALGIVVTDPADLDSYETTDTTRTMRVKVDGATGLPPDLKDPH